MKKILLSIIIILVAMSFRFQGDASSVITALKSGNSDLVSNYFDRIIDIKFPDKDEIKSIGKNQAGIALRAFYSENNIQGFQLSSQREMSGTMYIAGKLRNDSNGYNLSMMLKLKDGKHQIITVRIN